MSTVKSRVPDFPDGLDWLNTDSQLRLSALRGRLAIVCFFSFDSVQCRQVLADLNYLASKFRRDLVVLGVHSPRFAGEKAPGMAAGLAEQQHVRFPLVHDPDLKISRRFGIKDRPVQVLVDRDGLIVGALSGAGKRTRLAEVIEYQARRESRFKPGDSTSFELRLMPSAGAALSYPGRVLVSRDRIYIADSGHNQIVVASMQGNVIKRIGGSSAGFVDGEEGSAAFNNPQGMALHDQSLYVADEGNHAIRRINLRSGDVVTIAGTGKPGSGFDSSATDPARVPLNSPMDVVHDNGTLYIAMAGLNQIWALSLVANSLQVFSGCGRAGLVDGPPNTAEFAQPSGIALHGSMLYTVDAVSSALRCISLANGTVRTLAGSGLYESGDADGNETAARLQYPTAVEADPVNELIWVSDTYNNKIKRFGIRTRHLSSVMQDQPLQAPGGLAINGGNLYIANTHAHEVLRLDANSGRAEPLNVSEAYLHV